MKRKTWLIAGSLLGILLCVGTVVGWGVYSLMSNPSVKKGLESAGVEFKAMVELQQQLIQTCSCQNVGVQIMNGNTLNISLVNSEFNDLPSSQQADKARDVAQFVKDNYKGQAKIVHIVITFVKNTRIGPVNTNLTFSYPFDVSELE